jgi:hypothetical protein
MHAPVMRSQPMQPSLVPPLAQQLSPRHSPETHPSLIVHAPTSPIGAGVGELVAQPMRSDSMQKALPPGQTSFSPLA